MNKSNNGMGFCGIFGIIFVILKLCKVITWKWIWVLCPFWIGLVGWIILFVCIFLKRRKM